MTRSNSCDSYDNIEDLESFCEDRDFEEEEIHEFYRDVIEAIEDHADTHYEKVDLLYSLGIFKTSWIETYSATGMLWLTEEED